MNHDKLRTSTPALLIGNKSSFITPKQPITGKYMKQSCLSNGPTQSKKLSDRDLERLRASLVDEVQRYEFTLCNHPPDRMEKHGKPILARLRQQVTDVNATISAWANGSYPL